MVDGLTFGNILIIEWLLSNLTFKIMPTKNAEMKLPILISNLYGDFSFEVEAKNVKTSQARAQVFARRVHEAKQKC